MNMESKCPFRVGDRVRVIGVESSHSGPGFIGEIGEVKFVNHSDDGTYVYQRFGCAVEFQNDNLLGLHDCLLVSKGRVVFKLDTVNGQWFKYCDLELVETALEAIPDIDAIL